MVKKIRIKKPIYGKKVFMNKDELAYYKLYKELGLDKNLIIELHNAVGIADGYIRCDSAQEEIDAWQFLIDTGMAWKLKGWFSRNAMNLIDMGVCKEKTLQ